MLDEKFIEERKKDLLKQKKHLENELANLASKKDGSYKPKFPNFGDEAEDNEMEISKFEEDIDIEKHLEKMLEETNEALKRINNKTYGICEKCHNEIDKARLKAYPGAKTCVNCK